MSAKADEIVVLAVYENEIDANIVRGMLESNGIVAGVLGDNTAAALMRGLNGATWRLVVRSADLEQAQALLANSQVVMSRIAERDDAKRIWEILSGEIEVMRQAGRDQWQKGYPNPEIVASDIAAQRGRVLVVDNCVMGYCALITSGDPCYDEITEGNWLTLSDSRSPRYTVVHRIGIAPEATGQGLAQQFLHLLLDESKALGMESMRIDTNFDNKQMLHLLPKLGFARCGVVRVADGPRIAFEIKL